ncbi:hypothetical protein FQN57_004338 [Myotisia sp. PD_48]|nr:hypothetical protein FQN57_004338 [Myotisia sp. PD_48]
MMRAPNIYEHPDPFRTLVPLLQSHLPYSGPVLRVIQSFNCLPKSSSARYLATFPPTSIPPASKPDIPWIVAYVDIARGVETQIWIYSSLEAGAPNPSATSRSTFNAVAEVISETRRQLHNLLIHIRTELTPLFLSSMAEGTALKIPGEKNNSKRETTTSWYSPTGLLIGTLHDGLTDMLYELGPDTVIAEGKPIHTLWRIFCVKYVFDQSAYNKTDDLILPAGYRFHDRKGRQGVQPHQFELVLSRTDVPRKSESFRTSVAIYSDEEGGEEEGKSEEMPIGWVFMSFDGSMVVMHIEPEHRGRGLAALLAKEIMKKGMDVDEQTMFVFQPETDTEHRDKGWVYADVIPGNSSSRRVMEKMGGQLLWTESWVWIEVCVEGECSQCSAKS